MDFANQIEPGRTKPNFSGSEAKLSLYRAISTTSFRDCRSNSWTRFRASMASFVSAVLERVLVFFRSPRTMHRTAFLALYRRRLARAVVAGSRLLIFSGCCAGAEGGGVRHCLLVGVLRDAISALADGSPAMSQWVIAAGLKLIVVPIDSTWTRRSLADGSRARLPAPAEPEPVAPASASRSGPIPRVGGPKRRW